MSKNTFRPKNAYKGELKMKLKIKATSKELKPREFYIVYAVATVIATALRLYHSVKLIDPETGFYSSTNFTVAVFYGLLIAAGFFLVLGSFLSANNGQLDAKETFSKNKSVGIAAIILSFAFIIETFQGLVNSLYSLQSSTIYTDMSYYTQLMKNGYIPHILISVFALLSAIYFLVFAKSCLGKKCKIGSKKIFALMPVIWSLVKLISFFVKQISFVKVSSLLLEIAAMIFTAIFLYSLAQCISGVYADTAMWRLTGVGLTASMLLISLNLPKLLLTFISSGKYIVAEYPVDYAEFFLGLFILSVVLSLGKKSEKAEDTEKTE